MVSNYCKILLFLTFCCLLCSWKKNEKSDKVALVTGANKGIGYATVKGLVKRFHGIIYLTGIPIPYLREPNALEKGERIQPLMVEARNETLGRSALELVKKEVGADGDRVRFHQLDITDKDSITTFRDHIKKEHGGLDILINNAGFAYKMNSETPFAEQAEMCVNINYFGTKQTCDILFPILRPHARAVNVCSRSGHLANFGAELKATLLSDNLTETQLDDLMINFVRLAKQGKHAEKGFPQTGYGVSKAGEIALSMVQNREVLKDARQDIIVNACCPGYVDTDMSEHKGILTPDQGADTPIYLALLPPNVDGPRGKFVAERKIVDWATYPFVFQKPH